MLNFSSDQWIIVMLVFLLGLLVGGFLFSGGGRKWKQRYNAEVTRRGELESSHATREKEWREQDSQREAALRDAERNRPIAATTTDPRDTNNDGVVTPAEKKPGIVDRMLGRDRDGDGVPDRDERDFVDRDGDGVDDRDKR